MATQPIPQPSFLDTLRREAGAALGSVTGIPGALKQAFTQPPTPEENQEFEGDTQGLKRVGLGVHRLLTEPVETAGKDYAHGRVSLDNALQVAPEALGGAGGAILSGKAMEGVLPGQHPEVAKNALQEHVSTGGSTIDPRTGQSLAGSRHYTVGISPETAQHTPTAPTPEAYGQFVAEHRDVLARNPNTAIGTSYDPVSGMHKMELVGTTTSKPAAQALAQHLGEDHAYHLGTDTKVPTGATGEWQPSPLSVEERLKELTARTPQKETYSGTHYSDAKMDFIDGSRRGSSGAGAEAQRLRLGTQTGMGEDAPNGFHTYKAGSLPDAAMAQKANAHQVRGKLAFATTDTPEFQQGYADGVARASQAGADAQTAHQLGLNAAENAVRDAGYDGYFNPKFPNSRFHFGSDMIQPSGPKAPPEIEWPDQYKNAPKNLSSKGGGGANYSAADLDAFKAKHGITTPNGSAPGPAGADSMEAISRNASEKANGVKRVAVDVRSGQERPLVGVDAVDARPNPYEVILQRGPQGEVELDRGILATGGARRSAGGGLVPKGR